VAETLSVPRRFNGPLESGQGGYCSALLAELVDGTAEVTLRSPVPLDTALEVARDEDGVVRLLDGETLVAEAVPVDLNVEVPEAVSPPEARAARERYLGSSEDMFSRCFVCGSARDDALGVFAGTVDGRDAVASTWTPPEWTTGDSGGVADEFLWAVMDCPTYFAVYTDGDLPVSFLGQMAARIDSPVRVGEEHVVMAWPISAEGRKRQAGAAVVSGDGEVRAVARALMIEPREAPGT